MFIFEGFIPLFVYYILISDLNYPKKPSSNKSTYEQSSVYFNMCISLTLISLIWFLNRQT